MRDYMVARIARIYPLYFLTLIVSSFLAYRPALLTEHDRQVITGEFLRQLLMINAWSVFGNGIHWNFPAWSVSIEFFCYLFVFPGLFYAVKWLSRRSWRTRLFWPTVFMAASIYVYTKYYNQLIIIYGRKPGVHIPEISYADNLIRGILGFTAGWVIYASYISRDTLWRWATRRVDLVALGVIGLLVLGMAEWSSVQLMLLGFPLLVLGVSAGNSLTSRVLSWGPIHYLGSISYSVYLLHMPWYYFCWLRLGVVGTIPIAKTSSALILVLGLLVVAALSYHLIEVPARQIIRTTLQSKGARPQRIWLWASAIAATAVALFIADGQRISLFEPVLPPLVMPGEEITQPKLFERAAGSGWSDRENWGIWSVGDDSYLTVRVGDTAGRQPRLSIKGSFFLTDRHAALTARLFANDIEIARFSPTLSDNHVDMELAVPAAALSRDGTLRIRLQVDSPASPKSVGQSGDERILGFGLTSLKLVGGAPS
jgi:peptidoglycan/LPS O-acetylase OafA/YrhL